MSLRALALTFPAFALLAGCSLIEPEPVVAQPAPAAPVAAPAPAPVAAPTTFDGRFAGHLAGVRDVAKRCRAVSLPAHAVVQAGRVTLRQGRTAPLHATLNAQGQGSLTGEGASGTLRATPTALAGQITRGNCTFNVVLRKRR